MLAVTGHCVPLFSTLRFVDWKCTSGTVCTGLQFLRVNLSWQLKLNHTPGTWHYLTKLWWLELCIWKPWDESAPCRCQKLVPRVLQKAAKLPGYLRTSKWPSSCFLSQELWMVTSFRTEQHRLWNLAIAAGSPSVSTDP